MFQLKSTSLYDCNPRDNAAVCLGGRRQTMHGNFEKDLSAHDLAFFSKFLLKWESNHTERLILKIRPRTS